MTPHPAAAVAERFIHAIVWGEHLTVWELLSPAGRDIVLDAGGRRGLDAVQAERLRQGTSPQQELDSFLTGLVQGLRVDFAAIDLDHARATDTVRPLGDDRVEIQLECPANFGNGHWAAGSVVLAKVARRADHESTWLVDRVNPLVSRAE